MESLSVLNLKSEPISSPTVSDDLKWDTESDLDLLNWATEDLSDASLLTDEDSAENTLLESLVQLDQFINEDAFSTYWMDEKVFPVYEDSLSNYQSNEKFQTLTPTYNNHSTQNLLKEFESVFDAVNNGALTPPQSPPPPVFTTLQPIPHICNDHTYPVVNIKASYQFTPNVVDELAEVDELVRNRVEVLVPSSPSSASCSDSSSDDPEWVADLKSCTTSTRKRYKPYQHNPDKKNRKKEQNKNAATRYRLKKKAEIEEILEEEKQLMDKNEKFENQITDLQREIKYLKGLMRDLFVAKGILK